MGKKIIIDQEAYDPHTNCMYASAYVESSEPRTKYLAKGETVDTTLGEMRRLQQHGFGLISLQDVPIFLHEDTKDAFIAKSSFFVKEGMLYVPGKNGKFEAYLVRACPVLHKDAEESSFGRLSPDSIEKALSESIQIKAPLKEEPNLIPTDRFEDYDVTRFAFGSRAQKFGEFLKSQGVDIFYLYLGLDRSMPEDGAGSIPVLFNGFGNDANNQPCLDLYDAPNWVLSYLGRITETGTIRGVKTLREEDN